MLKKPPTHPPFYPIPPTSKDLFHLPEIDFHSSIINENIDPKEIKLKQENPNSTHLNIKPLLYHKKPNEDLRYSRGMSWSQSHDALYKIIKDPNLQVLNNNITNKIPNLYIDKMLVSEQIFQNPNKNLDKHPNFSQNLDKNQKSSIWQRIKSFLLKESSLSKESELIITINDLNSRANYDSFIQKLKSIDTRYIRQLRFKDLRNKFLIPQWKEIELLIRNWPLNSLKFEGTRLDKEHCRTLLYFLMNNKATIQKISFNYNGLTQESLAFLFCERLHVSDLKGLKLLSIKNNPCIYQNQAFWHKFNEELRTKTKNSLGFLYKVSQEIFSRKYQFLDINFSDCDLDDKKIKKIVLGLIENHSSLDISNLNLSNNEKIDENGWFLFTEKYLKSTIGLHTLNLSHCNLNDNSFKRLCEGIYKNEGLPLKTLNLSNNVNISPSGLLFFARKVLLKLKSLRSLLMVKCGLNDLLIEGLVNGLLLNEENIEIVSKRCNLSFSESNLVSGEKKLTLEEVDFSQNWNVSEKGWFKLLMPLISMASELKTLRLSDCVLNEAKLKSVLDVIMGIRLRTLDVSNNTSITELMGWPLYASNFLMKTTNLQILNLSDCNINSEKLGIIFERGLNKNFSVFDTLKRVDLSNNPNIRDFEYFMVIKELAVRYIGLEELILRKTGLNDGKIKGIVLELEKQEKPWFKGLKTLDISQNPDITESGLIDLCVRLLFGNKEGVIIPLEEILFEELGLNDEKALIILDSLRSETKKIRLKTFKSVSFSGNKALSEVFFKELGFFLCDFQALIVKNLSIPLKITLSSIQATNSKLKALFSILSPEKITLNLLDLSKNSDISNEGLLAISEASYMKITHIKLRNCLLNSRKLKDFSFKEQLEIESLDMSENPNLSCQELEKMLFQCKNMKELYLSQCNLKDSDYKLISQTLSNNNVTPYFKTLDLSYNKGLSPAAYKSFLLAFFAKEKSLNISAWTSKIGDNQEIMDLERNGGLKASFNHSLDDLKLKSICNALSVQKAEFPLKSLDLSKNKVISYSILEEFTSKVLLHSQNLESLILEDCLLNDVKMVPILKYIDSRPLNLQYLSLKGNKDLNIKVWSSLFEVLKVLPRFTSINLDDCGLDDSKIAAISHIICNKEIIMKDFGMKITHFSCNNNKKITDFEPLGVLLVEFLYLEEIQLMDNELNDNKLKALAILLHKDSKLKKIDISGVNSISDFAFNDFAMGIRKLKGLLCLKTSSFQLSEKKLLNLSLSYETLMKNGVLGLDFDIGENKDLPISSFLSLGLKLFKFKGIQRLCLMDCDIDDKILEGFIQTLLSIKPIEGGFSLKILDLSQNSMLNISFSSLFKYITLLFPDLEELLLKQCELDSQKLLNIKKGLTQNKEKSKIRKLDLSFNKALDENGWNMISKDLLSLCKDTLEDLRLSDCELKSNTFKSILEGIISHNISTLKKLDISKNWAITETALSDLFSLLILNKDFSLESLNLSECTLNDNKIAAISENFSKILFSKPKLSFLDLSNNKSITENGWKLLGSRIFHSFEKLRFLSLFNCDMDCDSKISNAIAPLLTESHGLQSLIISINAQNLHEGLMVLQESIYKGRIQDLKLKFSNDELLLKIFWSPLDFYNITKTFCLSENNKKEKKLLKTIILEPETFFPYVFKNPLMRKYEDIILNEGLSNFLNVNKLKNSLKQIIFINYDHAANDSLLSRSEISRIHQIFSQSELDKIYLDYTYNYTKYNLNELQMLAFLRLFPPKAFIIKDDELNSLNTSNKKKNFNINNKTKDSLKLSSPSRKSSISQSSKRAKNQKITLNGLKALFATLYQNYNINEITIDYDYDSMLNQGIAFSLREKLYQSFFRSKVMRFLKFFAYKFLSLFVQNAKHFKFSSDILSLNGFLKSLHVTFIFLLFFVMFYYSVAIFLPLWFIQPCGQGLAWISHYIFTGFVVISLLFESMLFFWVYPKIRPVYLSFHNIASAERKTLKSKIKRRALILAYIVLSQVAHYELYSKISFVRITYECGQNTLGIVATIFYGINLGIWLYNYVLLVLTQVFRKEARELDFQHINKFLEASHLTDFAGFFNALDSIAPYNVVQIPDIWITRKIVPHLAGLSINAKLFFFCVKFVLKTPIVIVQIIFLFFRRNRFGDSDFIVVASLGLSLVTYLVDYYKFMSVRPSTLYQGDFDELVRRNKKKRGEWIKGLLEERDRVLDE